MAQTTGKIAGNVFDANTEEALIGANVMVEGTPMGASVALDGSFFIINVPPGTYTIVIEMIGYNKYKVENLRVSVNRTAFIDATMETAVLEGEVIVVRAEKIASKKDQTGSMRTISSEQMDVLPVDDIQGVINMQAGVVNGHFRGGRKTEVTYMVDGLQVDESFSGDGKTVDLEKEAIEDLEVITGTFNAEYGRAMSGVVNAVTKTGGNKFEGSLSVYSGTYLTGNASSSYKTSNNDIFIGLDDIDLLRNKEISGSISGPIIANKLNFFVSGRYQDKKNHLNGYRKFKVDDFTLYGSPDLWPDIHPLLSYTNGDNSFVPMNDALNLSLMGKLSFNLSDAIKTSLLFTRNDDEWNDYNHTYKYNPDGVPTAHRETNMFSLQFSQMLSTSAFYQTNFSYVDNKGGYYLYDDPTSNKYVHDGYAQGNDDIGIGFLTGGQMKNNDHRQSKDYNAKIDFIWQVNKHHNIKTGFLYTQHELENRQGSVRNFLEDFGNTPADSFLINENNKLEFVNYNPYLPSGESIYADIYKADPYEFGAYIQDKMEHDDMVINFGLRLDYYNPNTTYPSQRRNPSNQLTFYQTDSLTGEILLAQNGDPLFEEEKMSSQLQADEQIQISPRLGLAYQLGDRAVLRFSYGHFFQMPPMYALFQNNSFVVSANDYETTMGNAQLKAQKTIQYEIGLWQQLSDELGLEIALYYRDIYDLLSAKVISTFNQVEYGLFTNKDYGNTKGLEVKLDYTFGGLNAYLNYTLQYTRGNADNPTQTFDRAGDNTDPVSRLIVMSWDQRHTLNATIGFYQPSWGTTLTGYYNSGSPYTYLPASESRLIDIRLPPNNDTKPENISVDLSSYYKWKLESGLTLQFNLNIFNLLDELNEVAVNDRTGRAYTNVVKSTDLEKHQEDFNDYYDRVRNPSQYAAPRYIKFGIGVLF